MPKCARNQYSRLQHLCWGILLNHDAASTLVLVMNSYALYLDVAGHPSDQPVLCAGGFLADEESWLKFEPAWSAALDRNGLPPVFHMTDFESKYKNQNNHWDILRDLISVISDHVLASFSNTVHMEDYRAINNKYPLEEMMGRPYGISARSAARLAMHWQNGTNHKGPMLVFVEKGTLHEGDMVECFRRDGLEDPIPIPKEHPAAQAADLFAWERAYYNRTSIRRPSLEFLKKRMPDGLRGFDGKWEKRALRRALDNIHVPTRKDMSPEATVAFHNTPKKHRKRTIR
jgi:hypothetical protein